MSSTMNQQDDHDIRGFETPYEQPDDSHATNADEINRVVEDVHSHDILFGRGNGVNNHKGNIFFRKLASQRKRDYRNGRTPSQRKTFVHQIYDEIKKLDPPGRFLMPTSHDKNIWYNVSEEKAIRKISQALRERALNDPPDIQTMKKSKSMCKSAINSLASTVSSSTTESRSRDSEASKSLPPVNYFSTNPLLNILKVPKLESSIAGTMDVCTLTSESCNRDSEAPKSLPVNYFASTALENILKVPKPESSIANGMQHLNANQTFSHQTLSADALSTFKLLNKMNTLSELKDSTDFPQNTTASNPCNSQEASSQNYDNKNNLENQSRSRSENASNHILSSAILNEHLLHSNMPKIKNEVTFSKIKDEDVISQEKDQVTNYDSKTSKKWRVKNISSEGPQKKEKFIDTIAGGIQDLNANQTFSHQTLSADALSNLKLWNKMNTLSELKAFADFPENSIASNPSHSQKASIYNYDDKTLENRSRSENADNLNILSSVVLNEHLLPSNVPQIKTKETFSKIKDESVLPQEEDQVTNYDSKTSKKRRVKNISSEGPKKESRSVDTSVRESKKRKDYCHHQVLLPLSCIGKSFLASSDCSDESRLLFEELSEIGNHENNDGYLYLPSIVGSLCNRIAELERDKDRK